MNKSNFKRISEGKAKTNVERNHFPSYNHQQTAMRLSAKNKFREISFSHLSVSSQGNCKTIRVLHCEIFRRFSLFLSLARLDDNENLFLRKAVAQ